MLFYTTKRKLYKRAEYKNMFSTLTNKMALKSQKVVPDSSILTDAVSVHQKVASHWPFDFLQRLPPPTKYNFVLLCVTYFCFRSKYFRHRSFAFYDHGQSIYRWIKIYSTITLPIHSGSEGA